MKKINILFLLIGLFILAACSDEHEPRVELKSAPSLDNLPQSNYVLEKDQAEAEFAKFKWNPTQYNLSVSLRNVLQMDKAGNNFASPTILATTTESEFSLLVKDINDILFRMDIVPEEAVNVEFRLLSYLGAGEAYTEISNVISATITPFEPDAPAYPENIYMIGEFAGWDWASDKIVELIPVATKEGHFWCISYFTAGSPFKWAPAKEWSGDFAQQDEIIGYEVVDGNAVVAKDGLYMIYIDLENKKIAIEEAQIFGIGDCFGSWDADTYPFTVDGAKASITTIGTGELRMYAASSISVSDWWTREFIILNGKIVYRGKGDDQERVNVASGKIVTLDFSDGSGTIK